MIRQRVLFGKAIGYKLLTLAVYSGMFGLEMGINLTLVSVGLYYAYDAAFTKVFKVQQTHGGHVIYLTGLPCSGKTTVAEEVERRLKKIGKRVERLDGDTLRDGLCSDLGFSAADRDENIRRVSHLSEMLARNGAIVVAAFVSPYADARDALRHQMGVAGLPFAEVYVHAARNECERRDVKGMWAKANAGEITGFTGVDDPYEVPDAPELVLMTEYETVETSADKVMKLIY